MLRCGGEGRPYLPAEVLRALWRLGGGDVLAVGQIPGTAGAAGDQALGAGQPVAKAAAPAPTVLRIEEVHGERTEA